MLTRCQGRLAVFALVGALGACAESSYGGDGVCYYNGDQCDASGRLPCDRHINLNGEWTGRPGEGTLNIAGTASSPATLWVRSGGMPGEGPTLRSMRRSSDQAAFKRRIEFKEGAERGVVSVRYQPQSEDHPQCWVLRPFESRCEIIYRLNLTANSGSPTMAGTVLAERQRSFLGVQYEPEVVWQAPVEFTRAQAVQTAPECPSCQRSSQCDGCRPGEWPCTNNNTGSSSGSWGDSSSANPWGWPTSAPPSTSGTVVSSSTASGWVSSSAETSSAASVSGATSVGVSSATATSGSAEGSSAGSGSAASSASGNGSGDSAGSGASDAGSSPASQSSS